VSVAYEAHDAFLSPLLRALAIAFSRRRKSHKHNFRHLELLRETEASEALPGEKLNVFAETASSSLRLAVWPDGVVWVWAASLEGRRRVAEGGLYATADSPAVRAVVASFEASRLAGFRARDRSEIIANLRATWASFSPYEKPAA
jgi:hypothetical protein